MDQALHDSFSRACPSAVHVVCLNRRFSFSAGGVAILGHQRVKATSSRSGAKGFYQGLGMLFKGTDGLEGIEHYSLQRALLPQLHGIRRSRLSSHKILSEVQQGALFAGNC